MDTNDAKAFRLHNEEGFYHEWDDTLPRPLGDIDLEKKAEDLGLKYFLVTASSLQMDQRMIIVPKSNIRETQENGVGMHGHFDYSCKGVDPECYFVPDPKTLTPLPWKPEVGWLAR